MRTHSNAGDRPVSAILPPGSLEPSSTRDVSTLDGLLPQVYPDLRRVASHTLRRHREQLLLRTTDLVHDAYLTLRRQRTAWNGQEHMVGVAAGIMRRILVDRIRAGQCAKRGGAMCRTEVELEDGNHAPGPQDRRLLALSEALERLQRMDPEKARLIDLRYVAGLSLAEAARILRLPLWTVKRSWTVAKLWLLRELEREPAG